MTPAPPADPSSSESPLEHTAGRSPQVTPGASAEPPGTAPSHGAMAAHGRPIERTVPDTVTGPAGLPERAAFRDLVTISRMISRGAAPAERRRRRLIALGAVMATPLLLAAGDLLLIRGTWSSMWAGLVTEPGLRRGTALAIALLGIPVLGFVYQASRIAQATQELRLSALRLAGATARDVRIIAAIETARLSGYAALLGCVLYEALQWAALLAAGLHRPDDFAVPPVLLPVAVLLVAAGGGVAGLLASGHVVSSPLGLTVRPARRRSEPYPLFLLVVGAVLCALGLFVVIGAELGIDLSPDSSGSGDAGARIAILGGAIIMAGLLGSASGLIGRTAHLVGERSTNPETLLAARTVEEDPRAWGRVIGIVGLVVFLGSATGWVEGSVLNRREPFWAVSMGLADLALLFALVVTSAALAVHRAEWLVEHRRLLATLTACGVPVRALRRAALREALIAAVPVCTVTALLGLVAALPTAARPGGGVDETPFGHIVLWACGRAVLMASIGIAATVLVTAASTRGLGRVAASADLGEE